MSLSPKSAWKPAASLRVRQPDVSSQRFLREPLLSSHPVISVATIKVVRFFRFSFSSIFSIIDFIRFCYQDNAMSDVNAHLLAQRIDTVLDILVAGDYHSAIHNLEILKAELLALAADDAEQKNQPKAPWEI
jgi:hypothetical protein